MPSSRRNRALKFATSFMLDMIILAATSKVADQAFQFGSKLVSRFKKRRK